MIVMTAGRLGSESWEAGGLPREESDCSQPLKVDLGHGTAAGAATAARGHCQDARRREPAPPGRLCGQVCRRPGTGAGLPGRHRLREMLDGWLNGLPGSG